MPDGSYSIAALQNYFEYIIKKHETIADVSPVLIYVNKINNRIVFKIKSGYKLELLSKETMRLLGSSADTIDRDKNSELVPKLESVDLVLSPNSLIVLKTINTEFSFIEIWFTDQDNRPLEIEDSVNISLVIGIGSFM